MHQVLVLFGPWIFSVKCNPICRSMLDRMGTRFLQENLNEQLGKHIKEKLPGIKTSLQKNIHEIDAKLKDLGYFDEADRNLLKMLYRYNQLLLSNSFRVSDLYILVVYSMLVYSEIWKLLLWRNKGFVSQAWFEPGSEEDWVLF